MNPNETKTERPKLLKTLCILSFIAIGASLLLDILGMFGDRLTAAEMKKEKVAIIQEAKAMDAQGYDYLAEVQRSTIDLSVDMNNNLYMVLFISIIVGIVGLMSVFYMWKGIKLGFHGYIIYSILSALTFYLYAPAEHVHSFIIYGSVFISGMFIFMYSRNLKWMS